MSDKIPYYRRYHGYDYTKGASLFITMATEPRRALFGKVENAAVALSDFGRPVLDSMEAIPRFNPGIWLYEHVLMPDHLHMNLRIQTGVAEPLQVLGAAMRRFKSHTTTLARKSLGLHTIWQQGYHDRICTSRRFIEAITRYIRYNPLKYELMHNQPAYMHICEPLDSSRLGADSFWKGIGNTALLEADRKLLAVRISQKVRAGDIPHVVSRMEDGHRPDSRYLPPLAAGRFLEIAEGNDETEFGRNACLTLNDQIAAMAKAGEGGALHWRGDGPVFTPGGVSDSGCATPC